MIKRLLVRIFNNKNYKVSREIYSYKKRVNEKIFEMLSDDASGIVSDTISIKIDNCDEYEFDYKKSFLLAYLFFSDICLNEKNYLSFSKTDYYLPNIYILDRYNLKYEDENTVSYKLSDCEKGCDLLYKNLPTGWISSINLSNHLNKIDDISNQIVEHFLLDNMDSNRVYSV